VVRARAIRAVRRRWSCPSDNTIASYLERRLGPKETSRLEEHLADCDFCLGTVGALVHQQRTSEPIEVPVHMLQQAIDAVPARVNWIRSWKWLLAPALAGIIVVSVLLLRLPRRQQFVASISAPVIETARTPAPIPQPSQPREKEHVRKLTTAASELQFLEPPSDSVVPRERLRFRWKAVAGAIYYEIKVVDAEGDAVWHGQETNATAQLPPGFSLASGEYFVWVRAYLDDGRTVKSDAVAFQIESSR
jgi:hypothetical protein